MTISFCPELWGKWRTPQHYHPLLCHLIDVSASIEAIVRRRINRFGLPLFLADDQPSNYSWLALLGALHDLGKAAPAFQMHPRFSLTEVDGLRQRLIAAGLSCPRIRTAIPHGIITAYVLPKLLTSCLGMDEDSALRFATIGGGHHGKFPTARDIADAAMHPDAIGGEAWDAVRAAIVHELIRVFRVPIERLPRAPDGAESMALAGLFSVADWIGSIETYFPYAVQPGMDPSSLNLDNYASNSRNSAERALRELGWLERALPAETRSFTTIFPNFSPNDLQRTAANLAESLTTPTLVLIESPMGEGKTEAAMYLAEAAASRLYQVGCYFALPTQATSNQMFTRIREFLERAADEGIVNLQLLHGNASLSAEFELLRKRAPTPRPTDIDEDSSDHGESATVFAAEWFTYRKRGLLAPYGVGTIDQALLAVLKTRHFFVRMFGLYGKVVIIDEVHAYDAYMNTILGRLLEWLAACGSSVILLSATLPAARRDELLREYLTGLGAPAQLPSATAYPRISWVSASGSGSRAVETSGRARRILSLCRIPFNEVPGEHLARLLAEGGCAAVICNTVARAQEVFTALKPFFPEVCEADGEPELTLFHARYLFEERDRREKLVLRRFGKPGAQVDAGDETSSEVMRPKRTGLVATQVIEQSLDLDFDVILTEFAPVDLMLQRAGRIHRHERSARPTPVTAPSLLIFTPQLTAGDAPEFGRDTVAVYHPHLLLRSWLALRGRDCVSIPEDVEQLIEFVYGKDAECPADLSETIQKYWRDSADELEEHLATLRALAKQNRIPAPGDEDLFQTRAYLEEESPEIHQSLQALTRISEVPSVDVVIMAAEEFEEFQKDEIGKTPDRERALHWLKRSTRIAHRAVARELVNNESMRPSAWRRSPFLRHHRIVHLDSNGRTTVGAYEVVLDAELGVVITKPS